MTVTVPVIAADGAKSTVTLPAPVVVASNAIKIDSYANIAGLQCGAAGWVAPARDRLPQVSAVATPYGGGFHVECADTEHALWYSYPTEQIKAILLQTQLTDVVIGQAQRWKWSIFLPSQTVLHAWHCGLLWEYHNSNASGHNIALDTKTFPGHTVWRFTKVVPSGTLSTYGTVANPSGHTDVVFDVWHDFQMDILWSTGTDGWLKIWMDGTQYVAYTGATVISGTGVPYNQFGWYSDTAEGAGYYDGYTGQAPVTNKATFGGISYAPI